MFTPRDNLLRALRRQGFDAVPFDCGGFCASQVEAFKARFGHDRIAEFFGVPFRSADVRLERTWTDSRQLFPRETLPEETDIDVNGVGHSHHPGCFHMTRMHHPLRGEEVTLDEVRNYPLPVVPAGAVEQLRQTVATLHQQGLAAVAEQACTVWEAAWYIRSMEDLMMDMLTGDERAVVHLDRVTALAVTRMQAAARSGADIVKLGDDIGMQSTTLMSVELWRTWLKPRLAAVIRAGKAIRPDLLVFYHSCGYVLPFLDDLIEVGVDILNPVQPECMAFEQVHQRVGGRLSFWGTIGTQTTLPFGTPQDVRAAVLANLRCCGPQGGIVIGPTHMVEPEVPWENLLAMRDACAQFVP